MQADAYLNSSEKTIKRRGINRLDCNWMACLAAIWERHEDFYLKAKKHTEQTETQKQASKSIASASLWKWRRGQKRGQNILSGN